MRAIKFRQMRVDGDWAYIEYEQNQCNGPVSLDFENYPMQQFTGLHDKNGTEIYEGDILRTYEGIHEVKYSERWGAFFIHRARPDKKGGIFFLGEIPFEKEIEVIGNVHENPELLEAGE